MTWVTKMLFSEIILHVGFKVQLHRFHILKGNSVYLLITRRKRNNFTKVVDFYIAQFSKKITSLGRVL